MKALILAAGYGTRLAKVTGGIPKPLVDVAGKSILERITEDICNIEEIEEIYIVTNAKYYDDYVEWEKSHSFKVKINIINDLTTSNENRLGGVGDIKFATENMTNLDDLLVVAGDSLFEFELKDFVEYYHNQDRFPCICVKEHEYSSELSRFGIVEVDNDNTIISFEEKPVVPKSNIVGYAIYIFPKETLLLLNRYESEKNNMDAPGNYMAYISRLYKAKAFVFTGTCMDIGTPKSLEEARQYYK